MKLSDKAATSFLVVYRQRSEINYSEIEQMPANGRRSACVCVCVCVCVTYAVSLADAAGVVDVAGPRKSQSSAVEVAVGEHVRQTERVVVVLRQQLEERLDAVVTRKPASSQLIN